MPDLKTVLKALLLVVISHSVCDASENVKTPVKFDVAGEEVEAQGAIQGFQLPAGFKCELVADGTLIANPVCFSIDARGRFYFAETFRFEAGVPDIRGRMHWLNRELASKTVEERINYTKDFEPNNGAWWTNQEDRVTLLWDSNNDGRCDQRSVFAGGFNSMAEGIGAGILARGKDVFYADIPNLWRLRDANDDNIAEERKSLSYGYGVRYGFLGHDLHGLILGPDGRLYFSLGDRGAHLFLPGGRELDNTESGAVFRCDLDGANLEIFHTGLRNPQELAFDDQGNLWTVDNNSDGGDPARVVYLAEGGDSGWRVGWQFLQQPNVRGAWISERLCYEHFRDRAAYALPPVSSQVGNGPSGLTYDPGFGLPAEWRGRFLLANFSGNPNSGVFAFKVRSKGAGFELEANDRFWWNFLPTDVDFGYDGCIYASDWINGWSGTGKGRLYRLYQPERRSDPGVAGLKQLFSQGFARLATPDLARILAHEDRRVRLEAQWELVERKAAAELLATTKSGGTLLARLHAIWGLGQLERGGSRYDLKALLSDPEAEVRAQVVKILGDAKDDRYRRQMVQMLSDDSTRVRFFAGLALGKSGDRKSVDAVLRMIRAAGEDPWQRHAGIMALLGSATEGQLAMLAKDESVEVRLAAVVALRRMASRELTRFLADANPRVVAEAARAINDLPILPALPALAALADETARFTALTSAALDQPSPRDAILRRIVNANRRVSGLLAESRLAAMLADDALPISVRLEATRAFNDWTRMDGKDLVTGLWRPLLPRKEPDIARVSPVLSRVLEGNSASELKAELLTTAGKRGWKSLTEPAKALLQDTNVLASVRAAALAFLGKINYRDLDAMIELARKSDTVELRLEGLKLGAKSLSGQKLLDVYEKLLATGDIRERQGVLDQLGETPGESTDRLLVRWLDDLLLGKVKGELELNLVEAAARRNDLEVKSRLEKFRERREALAGVEQFADCLTGGNADEGRRIFHESVEASCLRCHSINGQGGTAGPDLSHIATRGNRQYILESITFPDAKLAAGFESAQVILNNGTSAIGVIKRETAEELDLYSLEDGLVTIKKADIKYRKVPRSGMLDNFRQALSRRELRDLVEYLAGLR